MAQLLPLFVQGRALCLTALTLAREGKRVVVVDLDLEAPGIEGYFFASSDSNGRVNAGVVDYLLERAVVGQSYQPEIDDFVLPYSDPAIAASGGSLIIVPAGRVDDTYMERLGRVNLADIGRSHGKDNRLRELIGSVLAWRSADFVLVDCRTGFTDLGASRSMACPLWTYWSFAVERRTDATCPLCCSISSASGRRPSTRSNGPSSLPVAS